MSYSPIPIRTSGGNMLSMVVALAGALSLILVIALPTTSTVEAYPVNNNFIANDMGQRKHPITVEIENPEEVLSVLDNLMQNILVGIDYTQSHGHNGNGPQQSNNSPLMSVLDGGSSSNSKNQAIKRGIDLGLSRGFSGSQAAKHLMGMSAASFANGPGRR